jgi:hypothetical protein
MEYGSFIFYTLAFISVLTPVAIIIFDFFDIKFEVYGNYLLWFIALALFNAILPVKTKNIFGDIAKPIEEMVKNAKTMVSDVVQTVAQKADEIKQNGTVLLNQKVDVDVFVTKNKDKFNEKLNNTIIPAQSAGMNAPMKKKSWWNSLF